MQAPTQIPGGASNFVIQPEQQYTLGGNTNTQQGSGQQDPAAQPAPSPMLTANVISPNNYSSQTAPAVFNASKATSYLGNVGTQIQNLNTDSQTQQQAKTTPPQGQSSPQGQSQTTPQTQGQTPADPAAQLNDQINSILTNLGQGEQGLNDQQASATTSNNEGQQVTFDQAEQENQMQQAQQYQQYAAKLSSIQSGTYPLSAPEQQLLNSTVSQFTQAIAQQQVANQAYTGQMAEAMASLGINMTAPTSAIGNIYGAISTGQSKIAALDSQMAQTVSNLQLSFQKQDFDEVQSEWNNVSKQFSDRQATLAEMSKQVSDGIAAQKQEMQQYANTALSAISNSAQFTLTEKQDAIDNAFKSAQITETQRSDKANEAIAYENSLKGIYSLKTNPDGSQSVFDSRTGNIIADANPVVISSGSQSDNPGAITSTGIPLVDNNLKKTSSGVPYVDGTNLKGTQASAVQLDAAKLGIPFLGSTGADAIANIDTARANLSNIQATLQSGGEGGNSISPSNGLTRLFEIPNYAAEGFTQSGPEATTLASYNTYRSAAIEALRAVAGSKGLRINQAEIAMSIQNDIPATTDTPAVRDAKISKMNSMLDSQEEGLFGSQVYSQYNSSSPAAQATSALNSLVGTGTSGSTPTTSTLNNLAGQYGL